MPAITLDFSKISDKQRAFLSATEKEVGFGGARGGGKSWSVRIKASLLALQYAGIKILIVRRSYPELINNHVNVLRPMLHGVAQYVDKDKVFKFGNGSTIQLQYCSCDKDLDRLQGIELDVIFLDEATQLSEHQMKVIKACVRGTNSFPKRIYYTCNPSGQGMQYIKRIFIDRRFEDGENPDDYVFIQSLVTDNKALMEAQPDYVKQLEALPPKLRAAWLEGRWDVLEGQFFEDFVDRPSGYVTRENTHVIQPFDIPADWKIYRSFDWGYAHPFSCAWWAVDYDGVIYRILEFYGCTKTPNEGLKWTPDKVFSEIRKIEVEHPWLAGKDIIGVADPAIWDAETGESIADTAAKYGIYFHKGDHKRVAGWLQVHYRLQFDDNGRPMMYIFSNCKGFIRTIPTLVYDEHKPEDLDTEGEDHIADEVRYMCMTRPIKPKIKRNTDAENDNPLSLYLDIKPDDLAPAVVRRSKYEVVGDDEED